MRLFLEDAEILKHKYNETSFKLGWLNYLKIDQRTEPTWVKSSSSQASWLCPSLVNELKYQDE